MWLVAGCSAHLGWSLAVPQLLVRRDGKNLRISAPQIRFLTGAALEQLKDGAKVGFITQITMTPSETSSNILCRVFDHFIVSYDIWEEKFSAVRPGPPFSRQDRMSVPATEAWCLDDRLLIPPSLAPTTSFWIKLELRAEDPKGVASIIGEPGINLKTLVEIFSRPRGNTQQTWSGVAGPMRLQDLG
jgi:hypothetical protein